MPGEQSTIHSSQSDWVTTCWAIPWAEGEKVGDLETPSDAEASFFILFFLLVT